MNPSTDSRLWFYADANNNPAGPLSFQELKRLRKEGVISKMTQVLVEGGTEWEPFEIATAFINDKECLQPPCVKEEKVGVFDRALTGGCLMTAGGSMGAAIGFVLCLTGIGAIIGIPMILFSLGTIVFGPLLGIVAAPKGLLKGDCPYCSHPSITASNKAPGIDCPACMRRIVIREKRFLKVD